MTMMNPHFKEIPYITYFSAGDDENNPKPHYKLEFPKCIVGEVIKNENFDDGTPNCVGSDDYEFTLTQDIVEEDLRHQYDNRRPDWSKVKTIHFDGSCTVPRYKLSSFCSKNNIKVTRSEEKADIVLYGPTFKKNITSTDWEYFLKKDVFLKKAGSLKLRKVPDEMMETIRNHDSNLILVTTNTDWFIPKKGQIYGGYIKLEDESTWNSLTTDKKYCNQEVLLEDMGLEVMDEYTFTRVCQMFESEDDENHKVAMEIMANSNYGKSIVYLLELMRRYYGDKMFYTKDRHHVSFKALRVYLHYEPRIRDRSLNELIDNVAERNLLTESNYKAILKLILEEEEKSMGPSEGEDRDNDNWRCIQVDLSPKYKAKVIWDKKEEEIPVLEEPQPDFTA